MTPAQTKFYWREWAAAWTRLRACRPDLCSADANRERHDLHRRALGYPRSSRQFDNREFDAVLGAFRAISRPADLNSQRRQMNQSRLRMLWKIEHEIFADLADLLGGMDRASDYFLALLSDRWKTHDVTDLLDRDLRELLMTLSEGVKALRADHEALDQVEGVLEAVTP